MNEELNMRTESWCGHDIRFVEADGQWWAILYDICWALDLMPYDMEHELPPNTLKRVPVGEGRYHRAVNEGGIYELLFKSRIFEANKFRMWSSGVMKKLRGMAGLQGYEVMKMLEPAVQENIQNLLDSIYYDEETGKVMMSFTVAGGDVDQVELEDF